MSLSCVIKVATYGIKKSTVIDGGYGLFAERDFSQGDIISIYLGEYIDPKDESDYSMDYKVSPTETRRLSTLGGFPEQKKLYLGAHMMNDINWGKVGEEVDRNSRH